MSTPTVRRLLGAFFTALMLASGPLMAAEDGFLDENFGNLQEEYFKPHIRILGIDIEGDLKGSDN